MQQINLDSLRLLGDLQIGRPNLGNIMSVSVYRLTIYSIKSVLEIKCGKEIANEIIYDAGRLAGKTIYDNLMKNITSTQTLVDVLKNIFLKAKIGMLSVEKADDKKGIFVFNLSEDLDCSGLPEDGETKCSFDEGLISGVLMGHFKKEFQTKEIRCWGNGEKYCSFKSMQVSA
jgi:hypothetical protein